MKSLPSQKLLYLILCLVAMGFMRQASEILVIAFFIVLIRQEGQLNFGNALELGALTLCGITLFLFGYIGGIRVAILGLLLPAAYCIGAFLGENERTDNIEALILTLSIGMNIHLILNFIYELVRFGFAFRLSSLHYDIWSGSYIAATGAMANATAMVGCLYYLIFKSSKKNRLWGIGLLIFNTVYDLIMGGRSFFFLLVIGFLVGFVLDIFFSNEIQSVVKKVAGFVLIAGIIGIVLTFLYNNSVIRSFFEDTYFYKRVFRGNNVYENMLTTSRTSIRKIYLENMLDYPFGGRKIQAITNNYAHELYLDIYDIGGIIPYAFIIIYVVASVISYIRSMKSPYVDPGIKVLLGAFCVCMNAHFFVEPILSGEPILLFSYCMVNGYLASSQRNEELMWDQYV